MCVDTLKTSYPSPGHVYSPNGPELQSNYCSICFDFATLDRRLPTYQAERFLPQVYACETGRGSVCVCKRLCMFGSECRYMCGWVDMCRTVYSLFSLENYSKQLRTFLSIISLL